MNRAAWNQFTKARDHYRREVEKLSLEMPRLKAIQQKMINSRTPSYAVETPIVYNHALDDVRLDNDIRLILVADNPGRREQMAENRRYLVGPSGKIAEKFFRDNPSLNIDFRANVIILNKSPIHTPRTVELKELCKLGGAALEKTLAHSQRIMTRLLLEFHKALACGTPTCENGKVPIWICGYSEMKKGGVFEAYTQELKTLYGGNALGESVFLYRHFSMNQFTIDLKRQAFKGEPLEKSLERIGKAYREKYLL
jgi:hypothetical protein